MNEGNTIHKNGCIIYSYDLCKMILNQKDHTVGGRTLQLYQWYLILKENGWEVITFTYGDDQSDPLIYQIPASPLRRYYHIVKLIRQTRPKLIIQRAAEGDTLLMTLISRFCKVKFIYMAAHDADFIRNLTFSYYLGLNPIKRMILDQQFALSLKWIDYFIIQNESQKNNLLKTTSPKQVIKISNIWHRTDLKKNINDPFILWVGNFRPMKRPEMFISIAKQMPKYKFVMIGGILVKELFDSCLEQGSHVNNLKIVGPVPYLEIANYFASAVLFISTSSMEGFPNVFLQAWDFNIPVISTCDPDNIIHNNQLGIFCENESEIINSITKLMNDPELYRGYTKSIEKYFQANHNPQVAYNKLIEIINL